MGWANRITLFRIALAPVFAALFSALGVFPTQKVTLLAALWLVFLISESSDVVDGWVARKFGETSDLGKLLDPFSDVLSRLTLFLCFLLVGCVPLWFFLVVLYRELSMTFLRTLLMQKGVVQAASSGGKTKAVLYFLVSLVGMLALVDPVWATQLWWFWGYQVLLVAAAAVSLFSFWQYFQIYRKAT
ncbi:MAG: CDP-diacylglycerol--glycerol-3-phosphate 3-phosphatidyltransferase [Spirochaetales bacterium]